MGLCLACAGPISCEQILREDDRQAAGRGWSEAACHHDRPAAKRTAEWGSPGTKGDSTDACKIYLHRSNAGTFKKRIHVDIQTVMLPMTVSVLQAPARQIEPSPEALAQLVSMGFEEQRATSALQQSNNDVQAALSRLL